MADLPWMTPIRWRAPFSNRHVQTVAAAALRRPPPLPESRRERIDLDDGDFIDVDVVRPPAPSPAPAWVLVLHGLAGSSGSPAVRGMAAALVAAGHEACLMNYRGCSGEPNRLPRAYHGGASEDVRDVMRQLAAARPGRRFAAVGFSLGGNMLMKLGGEDAARVPAGLAAMVAISPPFDLARCAAFLDEPLRLRGLYRRSMLRVLRRKALETLARFPGCVAAGPADLRAARTFAAFDGRFTAPLHGFADAADYWRRCSGGRFLAGIDRPLLVLAAADDPFLPANIVPHAAIAANPALSLLLTDHGGHCGFIGGTPWSPTFWAERVTVDYLARHLP